MQKAIFTGREEAREYFIRTIEHERTAMERGDFATFPRTTIIEHCESGLRWIDCAPEGANFILAPLQDKHGIPCGGNNNENVGPGQNLREARIARGRHPISGLAV